MTLEIPWANPRFFVPSGRHISPHSPYHIVTPPRLRGLALLNYGGQLCRCVGLLSFNLKMTHYYESAARPDGFPLCGKCAAELQSIVARLYVPGTPAAQSYGCTCPPGAHEYAEHQRRCPLWVARDGRQ